MAAIGAGIGDIGAGACRAGAARRDKGGDRHRRRQDRGIDLAHRRVEAAWRVHAQARSGRSRGRRGRFDLAHDVIGDGRADGAIDVEDDSALGGARPASRSNATRRATSADAARSHHGNHGGPAAGRQDAEQQPPAGLTLAIIEGSRRSRPAGYPVRSKRHDVATARGAVPMSRAPQPRRWAANIVARLKRQRAAKNDGRLDDGEQRRGQERILQPDNEDVVHQIEAIGIGRQIADEPRMAGGKAQADGDQEKTAGGAGRDETQIGGELDGRTRAPSSWSAPSSPSTGTT